MNVAIKCIINNPATPTIKLLTINNTAYIKETNEEFDIGFNDARRANVLDGNPTKKRLEIEKDNAVHSTNPTSAYDLIKIEIDQSKL